MYADFALAIIGAYLLGSIPFGLLIARAHGKDLRSVGSGNIGATNVSRALGRKWAYVCFLLDVLKGLIPTLAAMLLAGPEVSGSYSERLVMLWLWLAVGCAAVVGHIFPVYIRFKGGKGVATSFGVALGIWPYFTICAAVAIAVWVAVVGDSSQRQLAVCRPLAAAGNSNRNTPDGDNPAPSEHNQAPQRNGRQNQTGQSREEVTGILRRQTDMMLPGPGLI